MKAAEPGGDADEEAAASEEAVAQEAAAEDEEGPEAEDEAAQPAEVNPGQQQEPPEPEIPAEIVLERPGGAGSVTVQTSALGTAPFGAPPTFASVQYGDCRIYFVAQIWLRKLPHRN